MNTILAALFAVLASVAVASAAPTSEQARIFKRNALKTDVRCRDKNVVWIYRCMAEYVAPKRVELTLIMLVSTSDQATTNLLNSPNVVPYINVEADESEIERIFAPIDSALALLKKARDAGIGMGAERQVASFESKDSWKVSSKPSGANEKLKSSFIVSVKPPTAVSFGDVIFLDEKSVLEFRAFGERIRTMTNSVRKELDALSDSQKRLNEL